MQHLRSSTTLQGGKYRIERVLGQGGFGITYLAHNTVLDVNVTIKDFFLKEDNIRDDNIVITLSSTKSELFLGQKEKFKKEAKRMSAIRNEHVISVFDLFEENGTAYYVMDYVDGENLSDRLKRTGHPMTESEVRRILPQILDALKAVHDADIWHLDLKPANIMIDKAGNIKLIDFGASKQLNAQKGGATTSTAISYTNGYAPREQMEQNYDKFGPWTDLYALGATLYNLLTNRRPPLPTDIDDDISNDKHESLPMPASVSDGMKKIVLWLMQTNRNRRPQTVSDLFAKLPLLREISKSEEHKSTVLKKGKSSDEETILAGSVKTDIEPIINQAMSPVIKELIDNMVFVEGGIFNMGRKVKWYEDSDEDEHEVILSSFSINKYQVTQKEWVTVMNYNPSLIKGDNLPVTNVSWDDCMSFIHKLNVITGKKFRLPTEAEWEYAARGGNKTKGYKYAGSDESGVVCWCFFNSNNSTHEVGSKQPNEVGLYDMSGNVWEWCLDYYGVYSKFDNENPRGPSAGVSRVIRGGCYQSDYKRCSVYTRGRLYPELKQRHTGFRLSL